MVMAELGAVEGACDLCLVDVANVMLFEVETSTYLPAVDVDDGSSI